MPCSSWKSVPYEYSSPQVTCKYDMILLLVQTKFGMQYAPKPSQHTVLCFYVVRTSSGTSCALSNTGKK